MDLFFIFYFLRMGIRAYRFSSPMVVDYDYGILQSPFQPLQYPYGILQYSFQTLQSLKVLQSLPSSPIALQYPYNTLQSPQELARSPLKTLLAKMSEMKNRMREKWSE
jgi:hypothetical protein